MSRSTDRSKVKATDELAPLVTPEEEKPEEAKPYFELIVGSFAGKLPGEPGYDPEKDRMMIGFQYGNSTVPTWWKGKGKLEEVTPYDFLTNPTTGKREGQTMAPHGSGFTDLSSGISSWSDLPPLHVWAKGTWLTEAVIDPSFDLDELTNVTVKQKVQKNLLDWPEHGKVPQDLFAYWIVSGEGTTGNNLYRIYELPDSIAKKGLPHHPRMWPKDLQEKKVVSYGGGGTGYGNGYGGSTATTPKTPSVPAGVRMRCTGCGHWFTMGDLSGHAQVCGKGDDADWAMMCHSDCGCANLDEASTAKPGFPRVKTEAKVAEEAAEGAAVAAAAVAAQVPVGTVTK